MKTRIIFSLIFAGVILPLHAQLYTPIGTALGTSTNNNIGIGANNPTKLLDICNSDSGSGESYIRIKKGIDATNVNREAGIILGSGAVDYGNTFKIAAMSSTGYFDSPKLNFKYISPAGGEIIDLLTIDSFGKVGIGTTSPNSKLTVNGNTRISGNLNIINNTYKIVGFDDSVNYYIGSYSVPGSAGLDLHYYGGIRFGDRTSDSVMQITNGKVGIGTAIPDSRLTVNGKIHATEVQVTQYVPADYVFEKYYLGQSSLKPDYTLLTLSEIEKFTKANHHLPNVPSAKEIKENGLLLGEMSNVLLQKIEELTLYVIEQNKRIEKLEIENKKILKNK
jgi:hypothetical protein